MAGLRFGTSLLSMKKAAKRPFAACKAARLRVYFYRKAPQREQISAVPGARGLQSGFDCADVCNAY